MPDLNLLLQQMADIASQPCKSLKRYLAQGKKVVGCFPIYTPEEFVHAAGMVPMGLWGGQVNPTRAGRYNPSFTCSIMRSCLEYGMTGTYDGLSCVVMPMPCDTFRGMSAAWRAGVKNIPVIPFVHPQNRTDTGARAFLRDEYAQVCDRLAKVAGRPIRDSDLVASIDTYNEHSTLMTEFAETANRHLDLITPMARHHVMKSALFIEKSEHSAIIREILRELNERPECEWRRKKVVLSGISAEPEELLITLHENGVAVVADDLAQESRQYRTLIPAQGDPMARIVEQWFDRAGCSTIHEHHGSRGDLLVRMAQKHEADGVVVCLMRFCDVEEYDYPYISSAAEEAGLRVLCLEIDQSTRNNEQSRTKIQSFVEMIGK
jgi:benzoyl-CoA reductase/2-hydroxyglutaryl-CoA dehydratase subunit BcrC/BadD/HgdB